MFAGTKNLARDRSCATRALRRRSVVECCCWSACRATCHFMSDSDETEEETTDREEHTRLRLAIPMWAHVPEKCGLHEVLPGDCIEQVNRVMAAESLAARVRLMGMEFDTEDLENERTGQRLPDMLTVRFHLQCFANVLWYDFHSNRRHGSDVDCFANFTYEVAGGQCFGENTSRPHFNTRPERLRMGRSCGWIRVQPRLRRTGDTVGLRLADALDLADPWTTRGPPGVHLRHGGDAHRRDNFKNWEYCTGWWERLEREEWRGPENRWWGAEKVLRLVDRADAIRKARPRGPLAWRSAGGPGPG